ncbi:MAG: hypothetical protein CM1200mP12_20790 [Gammaproteobacteria bacterium]|nr:MAG: hypothetical protein CM1200mP12_20790 [Gammaproteobacteria bacterium]
MKISENFLSKRLEDEGFTRFVVIKDTNKGPNINLG